MLLLVAMIASGRKSACGLNDRFLYSVGLTVSVVSSATSNVVAVGSGAGDELGREVAAGTHAVVHDDGLLEAADSLSDSARARMSCGTPAGRSTTSLIARWG